jgi:hypothetical protein
MSSADGGQTPVAQQNGGQIRAAPRCSGDSPRRWIHENESMFRVLATLVAAVAAASLAFAGGAKAAGGNYTFDGGTPSEQAQVRAGLNASAFNWSLVPAQITIHIQRGISTSHAVPGHIWLDADLLDSGRFAWGVVQMEYAHQVHFLLLDDQARAYLTSALGAKAWCWERAGLSHGDNGCERFSATLAWAYWPSNDNAMRPSSPADESAAMAPARFRTLLSQLLSAGPTVAAQV